MCGKNTGNLRHIQGYLVGMYLIIATKNGVFMFVLYIPLYHPVSTCVMLKTTENRCVLLLKEWVNTPMNILAKREKNIYPPYPHSITMMTIPKIYGERYHW